MKLRDIIESIIGETLPSFQQIIDKYDPDGQKHDLTLTCVKCKKTQTCRCSAPKRKFEGICDECMDKN